MIFAFMDESGHPHPKDAASRPVLVSVCIQAEYLRAVCIELNRLKRRILQKDHSNFEAKGRKLINRRTFHKIPEKREFVESFFDTCRNLPLTIFAIVMERPQSPPPTDIDFLPMQFRHLLYRINRLLELSTENRLGAIFFDGDGSQYSQLSIRFSNWLYKSRGGQSLTNIVDSPFFVDSRLTSEIQIADMVASVIRIYEEKELFRITPIGDVFLSSIIRYYNIIKEKTRDLEAPSGDFTWYGFERMPERFHYGPIEPEEEYTIEDKEGDD
jgi:hypothetical protein